MSELFRLYKNPLIPEGKCIVKIIKLTTEPRTRRPFIEVVFAVSGIYGKFAGIELYCPIHCTPDADPVYEGFMDSFGLTDDELVDAEGRYAKVCVKQVKYESTSYTGVRFFAQSNRDRAQVEAARRHDERMTARKEAEAKKKAESKAKKQAEKEAYEAAFGPRGRGRPRLTRTMPGVDLLA